MNDVKTPEMEDAGFDSWARIYAYVWMWGYASVVVSACLWGSSVMMALAYLRSALLDGFDLAPGTALIVIGSWTAFGLFLVLCETANFDSHAAKAQDEGREWASASTARFGRVLMRWNLIAFVPNAAYALYRRFRKDGDWAWALCRI